MDDYSRAICGYMVFTGAPNDLRSGGVGSTGVGDSRDCEENLGSEEDSVLQLQHVVPFPFQPGP